MAAEKVEQQLIKAFVKTIGGEVWDTSQGFRGGSRRQRTTRITEGLPDLLVFLPPKAVFFFWEVKGDGGRVTDDQRKFQAFAGRCNVACGIGDFDDFKKFLTQFGYGFL